MEGGWFPLGMSAILAIVMTLVFWKSRKELV